MHFVDIWLGNMALDAKDLGKLHDLLDKHEQQRANTFTLQVIRDRYVATRGLLRTILANYLNTDPTGLQFAVGEYGKPTLCSQQLYFNLSHTADSLAIVASDLEHIGIDIEQNMPRSSLFQLAERCFSAKEFATWRLLPETQRQMAFYQIWTQKEAFVKAVGRGIALGLDQCEVSLSAAQLDKVPTEYGLAQDWRIIELSLEQGLCGAVVAPNAELLIKQSSMENLI